MDWVSQLENDLPFFGGGLREDNKASSSDSDAAAAGNASSSSSTRPILILFHGLAGGSHETYVCIVYVMLLSTYFVSIMHACKLCCYLIMDLYYMHKFHLEATKFLYVFMYCVIMLLCRDNT